MSMLTRLAATGVAPAVYVDDVFSTFLYTGNGSSQTITNGIDLSGKGGMVWTKARSNGAAGYNHIVQDTVRGVHKGLFPNRTDAEATNTGYITAFNSNGFSVGNAAAINGSSEAVVSWAFREQAKFFDVVTYTGDGNSSRNVAHALGVSPGFVIIKSTSASGKWSVAARLSNGNMAQPLSQGDSWGLNLAGAGFTSSPYAFGNASTFRVDAFFIDEVNASGATYVAYLFAHDTSASGLIQCGSYTGNGSATGPTITLGWEPQWLMIKRATGGTGNWNIFDTMRGMTVGGDDWYLEANTVDAEASANWVTPTATGFQIDSTSTEVNNNTDTYIYVAIRRSNKPPTAGTQVFQPTVYTGTNVDNRLVDTTIAPDMVWVRQRDDTVLGGMVVGDRLRGQPYLLTGTTDAEVNDADALDQQIVSATEYGTAFSAMNGFYCGNDATAKLNTNTTSNNHVALAFKRAAKFFDVVCYTGDGTTNRSVLHSLGVKPELIITKNRSGGSPTVTNWMVSAVAIDANWGGTTFSYVARLNTNDAAFSNDAYFTSTAPTASQFYVTTLRNYTSTNFVAYLFASLPGISKVGTYTGNGSNQTVNCGFAAGARFVLVKRTDSTGDWYVWDTSRGIVASNDPHLSLNSTATEVTTNDSIDPDNSGFTVNQVAATNINVSSATYLYLAIA